MVLTLLKNIFFSNKFTKFIRFTLVVGFFVSIYEQNWMSTFVIVFTFITTYFHVLFRKYDIIIPREIQVIIIFFIYCSLVLGEAGGFYEKYYRWDRILHGFSGIALGFIGFLILYVFYKSGKFQAPPIVIVFFSICFAISLGAVWEIFEFLIDEFFGANMQSARNLELIHGTFDTRLGVNDTMYDLILDSLGAIYAGISGYIFLKKGESYLFFDKLVKKFEKANKGLFRRKNKNISSENLDRNK